jgi:hypothetical protein
MTPAPGVINILTLFMPPCMEFIRAEAQGSRIGEKINPIAQKFMTVYQGIDHNSPGAMTAGAGVRPDMLQKHILIEQ